MDRQEWRIVFERGDIRLHGWVPERMEVDAILDEPRIARLAALMPGAEVATVASYSGEERKVTSRHRSYEVDRRVRVSFDGGMSKSELYGHVLRSLLADQVRAIRDPSHEPRVTAEDGLGALQTAVKATWPQDRPGDEERRQGR
jgi:hypothetical protein